ncbi:hypothetical protein ACFVXC_00225 [Streptomyces sp. NPDC058257]|uniref:hypothetical protein n=1 Tax=Streptomyces sp. NPDC058257 TaxID=3346409 RepID=UPI0036E81834
MRIRHTLPLSAAVLAVLMSGCADEQGGSGSKEGAAASTQPSVSSGGAGRPWEPDDALRRAEQALKAAADDGREAELVDSGTAYLGSGLKKSFRASDDKPYRFEITCDTDGAEELALTLARGSDEQAYGVGCGDREADHFNLPAGKPFTAHVKAERAGMGLIAWRLTTVAPGDVNGCDDDVDGCED